MSAHTAGKSLFLGNFVHSKSLDELEFLHETAVCVDDKGVIVAIEKVGDQKKAEETLFPKLGWIVGEVSVRIAKPGQFFFPGFIGLFPSPIIDLLLIMLRYSYPCLPISQCRNLWQDHSPRLAEHLHLSYGKQSLISSESQDCLYSLYRVHQPPR
jgi:hypothetical protein